MSPASPGLWPTGPGRLLLGLAVLASAAILACGSSPTIAACGSVSLVNNQPRTVVLLLDGFGSEETVSGTFHPIPGGTATDANPTVISYCPIDRNGNEQSWPDGLSLSLLRWSELQGGGSSGSAEVTEACKPNGGLATDACLVARLAGAGSVLLPYSYTGAALSSGGGAATFHLSGYTAGDSRQDVTKSVAQLGSEIHSVEATWPQSRIVLIGHSGGGLIAEAWWELAHSQGHTIGDVGHVFTLDAPINGVENCGAAKTHESQAISDEFCRRWNHRDDLDQHVIIPPSSGGTLTTVGTPHDPAYSGIPSGGGDLQAQVVYSCPASGPEDRTCIASPPSFIPAAPECDGLAGNVYGTTGHDLVKTCPEVVHMIVQAVDTLSQSVQPNPTPTTGSGGTTGPTPPGPTAVADDWLSLFNKTQHGGGIVAGDRNPSVTMQRAGSGTVAGHALAGSDIVAGTVPQGSSFLDATFTYRGSCTAYENNNPLNEHSYDLRITGVVEVRNIAIADHPTPISPAESANGVTSNGTAEITFITRWRPNQHSVWHAYTDSTFSERYQVAQGRAQVQRAESFEPPTEALAASVDAQRYSPRNPC